MTRVLPLMLLLIAVMSDSCVRPVDAGEELSRTEIVDRVREDIRYLASDDLEGRGLDTAGIQLAAERIIDEFRRLGVRPGLPDDSYLQPFPVTIGAMTVADETRVALQGPGGVMLELEQGEQFQPLRKGADGSATGELVFVGYGITAPEESYDEYAGVDVEGRIVVMIRREPRQGQADGGFNGTDNSSHAYIQTKLERATANKAAGIIFVNDPWHTRQSESDELTPVTGFGAEGDTIPFVHVKQAVIDRILAASPLNTDSGQLASLDAVADHLDETLKPVSQPLDGWTAEVTTRFATESVIAQNVIGVIEGDGPLADETIVIGAHYDHLGYGGYGSRARDREGEIHNGADDNASGTAAVLELARRIATGPKPRRRVVFVCFSAEERGLIGSKYYVTHPPFPLDQTVFMMNFDMIGNLKDNRVQVNGVGTAKEFRALAEAADAAEPVRVEIVESPFGGSDHLPFYQQKIPVMFCFTGMTSIYHTPDDDFETLNIEGAVTVIDYAEELFRQVDSLDQRPTFQTYSRSRRRSTRQMPSLGFAPELSESSEDGVLVRSVRRDSPADTAGLKVGDVVTHVNANKIDGFRQIIESLSSAEPGDTMTLTVRRGEETIDIAVELGEPGR